MRNKFPKFKKIKINNQNMRKVRDKKFNLKFKSR